MRVIWHPEAEAELIEAAQFYDGRVAGLGADLLDAVDAAVRQIRKDPDRFPFVEVDVQSSRLKRFPFSIYFRHLPDSIRILVVKHHSRHPDYWKPRR